MTCVICNGEKASSQCGSKHQNGTHKDVSAMAKIAEERTGTYYKNKKN